ncbi:hypothetical protein O181_031773 [Austropuccinia psidii MF-1]|uniref:Uncharacterized protein n=1 Tax=Austropuccinia psidii MF-1 TaxID=1389203 RepID=A0A9Q3D0D3_9BASI|nr:hypothetical protein [Austropuccinia psidii MF-1]
MRIGWKNSLLNLLQTTPHIVQAFLCMISPVIRLACSVSFIYECRFHSASVKIVIVVVHRSPLVYGFFYVVMACGRIRMRHLQVE